MPLNPGDKVLVKLSNKKQPEEDTYTVLTTRGTEVYARNDKSGQVLRRHLSRFTKIMEKPAQPPAPIQVDQADQGQSNDDLIPLSVINNAQPPQPINLEPGTRQREEPREEPQNQPRRVCFGRRARERSFNAEDQVRTTRSKTAKSGVPVPEFKTHQRRWSTTNELWKQPSRCWTSTGLTRQLQHAEPIRNSHLGIDWKKNFYLYFTLHAMFYIKYSNKMIE